MSVVSLAKPALRNSVSQIWFTRCGVPTATGLAYKLGWLAEEFAPDGITIPTLQEASPELGRRHYDHGLDTLIREGGNSYSLGARAQGAPTRLIGLTWIDEWQTILVRSDSDVAEPEDLRGLRLALPSYSENPIADHVRGTSVVRSMSLHGYKGALSYAGLTFDDVDFVEVSGGVSGSAGVSRAATPSAEAMQGIWPFEALANGRVDAIYVKGAAAVDAAYRYGLRVGVNLDKLPERRFRVNNGTPRSISVHQSILDNHFDLVVRFLYQTLRAAEWAKDNLQGLRDVLQSETRGSSAGVTEAYGENFHLSLHPDLSEERLALFERQKKFLWLHGFIEHDFSLADWVDHRPLEAAVKLLRERQNERSAAIA